MVSESGSIDFGKPRHNEGLRSVQKQLEPEEAKALKKLRRRWLKASHQLHVDELLARYEWQRRFPQLREMVDWVQDLRL
jgi:hypothetical protein